MEWAFDDGKVDWAALSELYRIAPLGNKPADRLRRAYANSMFKCFVFQDGAVIGVTPLRGSTTREDYWRDMEAVLVEGKSGLVVYSEFAPLKTLKPAQMVKAGEQVGALYHKGYSFRPTAKDHHGTHAFMHLELHTAGTRLPTPWVVGKPQPKTLIDPTPNLLAIAVKK